MAAASSSSSYCLSPFPSPLLLRRESAMAVPCFLPKLPLVKSRNFFPALFCISPSRHAVDEQEILQFVAESNDRILPCVRTFENDLARLSLVGSVGVEQALTAAAADGGRAASEHIQSGMSAMVVETVSPGPSDEHATVSTRLFLPAERVRAKARKLKASFKEDVLSGVSSQNILALTFRQVVLQQLWNFELVLFGPGIERDMEDLETPREVATSFFLSSSDDRIISVLAEAVAIAALHNTETSFLRGFLGKSPNKIFSWFGKRSGIASRDSSVVIYQLLEHEIVENAETLLEKFNSSKEMLRGMKRKQRYSWWTPSAQNKLERLGGSEFSAWVSEYVPVYKLQVDADKAMDVKFEGWRNLPGNKFEVLLTHSQMVRLAEILDMYYDDAYSLPSKELSCGTVANVANLSEKRRNSMLMKTLSVALASGIFLITLAAAGQFGFSFLRQRQKHVQEHRSLSTSETEYIINESVNTEQLNECCVSVIKRIKEAFGWHGDIMTDLNAGAWIGQVPEYLKMTATTDDSTSEGLSTGFSTIQHIDEKAKSSVQDIASYQVVLSTDGKLVGFQPTSGVGVNQWAANPLAKELYGGRKLTPGFIEPRLNIELPDEVVVIELLMSIKDKHFALARPFQ
ncbi:unnamed protein product [Linum trigynum]|uniref:Uncharacterized protein n=1 Tax=Linum trigynum TaxID=586398 RepID=A0AAV2GKS2_9ROSI